jgi:hypothetical protein
MRPKLWLPSVVPVSAKWAVAAKPYGRRGAAYEALELHALTIDRHE